MQTFYMGVCLPTRQWRRKISCGLKLQAKLMEWEGMKERQIKSVRNGRILEVTALQPYESTMRLLSSQVVYLLANITTIS